VGKPGESGSEAAHSEAPSSTQYSSGPKWCQVISWRETVVEPCQGLAQGHQGDTY